MPHSSFTSVLDEAKKALADFATSMKLVADAYQKSGLTATTAAAAIQRISIVDDDGTGTTGTIMSIHNGVPTDEEIVRIATRLVPGRATIIGSVYDDPMLQKYWVSLSFIPFDTLNLKTVQQGLSYLELQCWPAGTRSAFECLVTRMVNTEFGLGLNSYTLFAGDVRKALLADIAERFGNLPLTVYVGDVIITVGDGEGYFFGTNAPTRLNSQSYEELRDRILMKIFQDMEEVEDDD